jgi:hypothetical protein
MAKGVKMREAVVPGVGVTTIDDIPDGTTALTCSGCGVAVRKVPRHTRNAGTVKVDPYLSLVREEHRDDCKFSAAVALRRVVAQSNAATGTEIFVPSHDGFEYRLHILDERLTAAARRVQDTTVDPEREAVRNEYQRSERSLTPYLRTATAVARLYARLETDAERWFAAHISVRQRDMNVVWTEFCYDETRLNVLARRLRRARGGTLPHSVAVVFRLRRVVERDGGDLRVDSDQVRFDDDTEAVVQLYATTVLKHVLAVGRLYVAVGRVFAGKFTSSKNVAVRMMVPFPQQIAAVDEDGLVD